MKGQQYNPTNHAKRKADDFVANTGARNYGPCRKGPPAQGPRFDLDAVLNQPCPKHGTDQ